MMFDPAAYLIHVKSLDMAEDRKLDMIRVVAAIMQSFVDRAFGQAPEQILLGTGEGSTGVCAFDQVQSNESITSTFNDASAGEPARKSPPC